MTACIDGARLTHLGETGAQVSLAGTLENWQDVRLQLLDENLVEIPGKIYGKVSGVETGDDGRLQAYIRFTSVSREIYQVIRQAVAQT